MSTWQDCAYFFAAASTMMRRILVDYARARLNDKLGEDHEQTQNASARIKKFENMSLRNNKT